MSANDRLHGHCLCGAVEVSVAAGPRDVSTCHCGMCRRWHGGPGLVMPGPGLRVERGEDRVGRFRSSGAVERCFCTTCGSALFFHGTEEDDHYVVAGLFDAVPGARLDLQIYTDAKPDWYAFANDTRCMTGEQFLASLGDD